MVRFMLALAIASLPLLAAGAAGAQTGPPSGTSAGQSDVTVRGPERMVCRAVRRTATRMRVSRVCRPASQLTAGNGPQSGDEQLDESADRLDAMGADDISTNDQRDPMDRTPDTPLGPR